MKTNDVQIEIEGREGREENNKDKSTSATQERKKKEDSTQREYAYFRLARSVGGGVAPSRNNKNNRIRHQGKQGSESKSEEGDTRIKQKRTRRKDNKRTKKEQGMGHGERHKGQEKNEQRQTKR